MCVRVYYLVWCHCCAHHRAFALRSPMTRELIPALWVGTRQRHRSQATPSFSTFSIKFKTRAARISRLHTADTARHNGPAASATALRKGVWAKAGSTERAWLHASLSGAQLLGHMCTCTLSG